MSVLERPRRYWTWKSKRIHKRRVRVGQIKRLPPGGDGVELGVWRARHAEMLWKYAKPSSLILVDQWKVVEGAEHEGAFAHEGRTTQEDLDALYDDVCSRFSEYESVSVIRQPTVAAAKLVKKESIDWIYVDADHAYKGCKADLNAWWPKIKPGGVMFGDDYQLGMWWGDGVVRAVNELAAKHGVPLELKEDQWWIVKPRD